MQHLERQEKLGPGCGLVMTKESSSMMMTHTGNLSSLRWQEVARRQGAEEVAVIWAYSVALVWLLRFVSKRFLNEIINWLDYQSNISKSLITKAFDNQAQLCFWLSKALIIKPKNPTTKSIRVGEKAWYVPLEKIGPTGRNQIRIVSHILDSLKSLSGVDKRALTLYTMLD